METCIRECNFILLICTPKFSEKANRGEGGVGYEKIIVTGEIFQGIRSPNKIVPIIRIGEPAISIPSYLKSRLYIDLRDDSNYNFKLEELLRHIFEEPKYVRPVVGLKPSFGQTRTHKESLLNTGSIVDGQTLTIGFIASTTIALETAKPFLEQIIAPDLTTYTRNLGRNINIQFLIEDANGQANTHLEKIQQFHSRGVDLIIGGGWSSQAQASLSYVNSNNMLLVSTSSTSPTLAIANDRLFRMCTSDTTIAPALANVMWAAGVKTIVIFQRGDSWADNIVNQLSPIWIQKGGKIYGDKIRYAGESTEFANYLTVADEQVKTAVASYNGQKERVGVVMLAFNECAVILQQAASYPNIYNVHWWGSDGTAKVQRIMDASPTQANHVGFYSLLANYNITPSYLTIEQRYVLLTKQQFSMYSAYLYDAAFAITKAVLETGTTDASKVSAAFPVICNNMYGISGWCKLDLNGDRASPKYDVWGFYPGQSKPSVSVIMAQYDPDTQKTTFIPSVLGYTPIGP
ncbi:MAG: ABC transporter substrate-binding protein [Candidatus Bathyarchaeota archaeon]|nr:ABC transporter substrate-binding protein [Candidatus Bathyarchaeota archaeon]